MGYSLLTTALNNLQVIQSVGGEFSLPGRRSKRLLIFKGALFVIWLDEKASGRSQVRRTNLEAGNAKPTH